MNNNMQDHFTYFGTLPFIFEFIEDVSSLVTARDLFGPYSPVPSFLKEQMIEKYVSTLNPTHRMYVDNHDRTFRIWIEDQVLVRRSISQSNQQPVSHQFHPQQSIFAHSRNQFLQTSTSWSQTPNIPTQHSWLNPPNPQPPISVCSTHRNTDRHQNQQIERSSIQKLWNQPSPSTTSRSDMSRIGKVSNSVAPPPMPAVFFKHRTCDDEGSVFSYKTMDTQPTIAASVKTTGTRTFMTNEINEFVIKHEYQQDRFDHAIDLFNKKFMCRVHKQALLVRNVNEKVRTHSTIKESKSLIVVCGCRNGIKIKFTHNEKTDIDNQSYVIRAFTDNPAVVKDHFILINDETTIASVGDATTDAAIAMTMVAKGPPNPEQQSEQQSEQQLEQQSEQQSSGSSASKYSSIDSTLISKSATRIPANNRKSKRKGNPQHAQDLYQERDKLTSHPPKRNKNKSLLKDFPTPEQPTPTTLHQVTTVLPTSTPTTTPPVAQTTYATATATATASVLQPTTNLRIPTPTLPQPTPPLHHPSPIATDLAPSLPPTNTITTPTPPSNELKTTLSPSITTTNSLPTASLLAPTTTIHIPTPIPPPTTTTTLPTPKTTRPELTTTLPIASQSIPQSTSTHPSSQIQFRVASIAPAVAKAPPTPIPPTTITTTILTPTTTRPELTTALPIAAQTIRQSTSTHSSLRIQVPVASAAATARAPSISTASIASMDLTETSDESEYVDSNAIIKQKSKGTTKQKNPVKCTTTNKETTNENMKEQPTEIHDKEEETEEIRPDLVILSPAQQNDLLMKNKWENKIISQYEEAFFSNHLQWYYDHVMLDEEELLSSLGFYEMEYPQAIMEKYETKIALLEQTKNDLTNTEENCISCKIPLIDGQRITILYNVKNKNKEHEATKNALVSCTHKFCEECSYGKLFHVPVPTKLLSTPLFAMITRNCPECNFYGRPRKFLFNKLGKLNRKHPDDWKEGFTFPDNRFVYAIHKLKDSETCYLITDRDLARTIGKMVNADDPNVTTKDLWTYRMYERAISETFLCNSCTLKQPIQFLFHGKKCKVGCTNRWCMDCCAKYMVRNWASRIRSSNDKYIQGILDCKLCKQVSRMVNEITNVPMTKWSDSEI